MELPRFHYFLGAQPYMTVQQGQPSSATRFSLLSRISLSSVFDFSSALPKNFPVWCFSLTSSQFDRDVWKQGWEPILAGLKLRVLVLAEHGVSQLDFVVPDLKRDGLGVRAVRLETTLDGDGAKSVSNVTGGTSEALTLPLVHMQTTSQPSMTSFFADIRGPTLLPVSKNLVVDRNPRCRLDPPGFSQKVRVLSCLIFVGIDFLTSSMVRKVWGTVRPGYSFRITSQL